MRESLQTAVDDNVSLLQPEIIAENTANTEVQDSLQDMPELVHYASQIERKRTVARKYQKEMSERRVAQLNAEYRFAVLAIAQAKDTLVEDWNGKKACVSVDPEIFFPEEGNGPAAKEARAICFSCVVRSECLGFALVNEDAYELEGVWGGTTRLERRAILRRRAKELGAVAKIAS